MTIPFSFPQLGSSQVIQGGEAPNPMALLLQSFLQAAPQGAQNYQQTQDRQQRASISSAEMDIRKQELALQIAAERTKQEEFKHKQTIAEQQGKAAQIALEPIMAHLASNGGLASMLPSPQPQQQGAPFNPQGGGGQSLPSIQQTPGGGITPPPTALSADMRLSQFIQGMDPQAAAQFVSETLPHIMALRKSDTEKGQQVQTGEMVTTFVPGKGFWDPKAEGGKGGYVPTIERGMSKDQKEEKAIEHAIALERLNALRDARVAIRAQVMTNQFDRTTKDLRDRARIIMQAQQTIGDAMHNPDPMQRRVLYSSAIANFVQAADQKAQLRYQLLNYFKKNIDPSIGGSWNTLKDRMLSGSLPKYVGEGMLTHIGNLLQMSRSEYEKHRTGEIKRHPELVNWLPDADEYFTNDLQTTVPGAVTDPSQFFPPKP